MKERQSVRYDTHVLPKTLCNVTVSWGVDFVVDSNVANFCAHGMKVVIPALMPATDLPGKNDAIKVKLPVVHVWLSGICVYATNEPDDSVTIGIYFYVPIEQNYLNKLLSKNINVPLQECSYVCYEWEVFKSVFQCHLLKV